MYTQAQKLSNSFKQSRNVQALSNVHPENFSSNSLFNGLAPLPCFMNAIHCTKRHVKDKHAVCKIVPVLRVLCMNERGFTKMMP